MKFYLKGDKKYCVKSNVAVNAIIKIIRTIIRKMKQKNNYDYFNLKNEKIAIVDEKGNEFEYIYKISKNENIKTNEYYEFDYVIELYKKLAVK